MRTNIKQRDGFTLIELLMVIAIIGVLAGILIPSIGAVKIQANIARSQSQLRNYVNAIQLFKTEYKYYPFVGTSSGDSFEFELAQGSNSEDFIKVLSARDPRSPNTTIAEGGNRRRQSFHSFSESEFLLEEATDTFSQTQLADAFDNINIVIVIDADGNGIVKPSPSDGDLDDTVPSEGIRSPVTAYVDTDPNESRNPTYGLWN